MSRNSAADGADSTLGRFPAGVALGIALFALGARLWVQLRTHSTHEDFLITFRYAENLAAGLGFAYNPGERVLGTTTPLYTLFLAVATLCRLDGASAGKALNIVADSAICFLVCRVAWRLGRPRTGWLAALLYASSSASVNFAGGGMETGLVTLASIAAVEAYIARAGSRMWACLALLALLRIDGLLLAAILGAAQSLRERRIDWRGLALAGGIVLPWVLFATAYFGSPVPTSLVAKLSVYARRDGALPNLHDFRLQFAGGMVQTALTLFAIAGAIAVAIRQRQLLPAALWMAFYYAAMLFSRVPAFGWYFVPPMPVFHLLVAIGLASLARSVAGRAIGASQRAPNRLAPILTNWTERRALGLLLIVAMPAASHLRTIERDVAAAQRLEDEVRRPLGEWLRTVTEPDDRILLEPIGYIGYYSRRRVIDLIGLVSPEALPMYRSEIASPLAEIVGALKPETLVLRKEELRELARSAPQTADQYEEIAGPPSIRQVFFVLRRR